MAVNKVLLLRVIEIAHEAIERNKDSLEKVVN